MELSIDTASELASIGLSREGVILAEMTWRCRRNHTVELLPAIETLLAQVGASKEEITALFVCTGPGMYTGLRVGISVAQGLARALRRAVVGVGRLELDAYPHSAFPGDIVAVHRAGRGELAWASYRGDPWRERSSPRLSRAEELAQIVNERSLVVGEVDQKLAALLRQTTAEERTVIASGTASMRRAATLVELGFAQLQAGHELNPALLRPLYLRPPAIGPQEERSVR